MKRQEEAFKKLKERFMKEPVLAVPDLDKKNEDGGECIRFCDRRSVVNRV